MKTEPSTTVPWWLTIDLSIIAVSMILVGTGFWIGVL
jgi:hypothetical protein